MNLPDRWLRYTKYDRNDDLLAGFVTHRNRIDQPVVVHTWCDGIAAALEAMAQAMVHRCNRDYLSTRLFWGDITGWAAAPPSLRGRSAGRTSVYIIASRV